MNLLYIQFLMLATPWLVCLKKPTFQGHSISGRHDVANHTKNAWSIDASRMDIGFFPVVIRLTKNNRPTV